MGEKFEITSYLDSNEKSVKLNFTQSSLTIIDFWFIDCPPCIQEMKQFEQLLKGMDNRVRVISISVNSYSKWKQFLNSPPKNYSFLSKHLSNWEHYVMKSNADPKLNNDIPGDNLQLLSDQFQSHSFPMYFVVDKTGTIIETPFSAVDYLKNNVLQQNKLLIFWGDKRGWTLFYQQIPHFFVEYSGYYWIVILGILGFLKFYQRQKKANY